MSVETPARPSAGPSATPEQGRRYRAVWRWHFYAGLIVAPVLLVLAVTGSLYLFKDQYEDWRYQELRSVSVAGSPKPLAAQLEAAKSAHPGRAVASVIPAGKPGRSTRVIFEGTGSGPFAPGLSVYVNPYDGTVLGQVDDSATLMRQIRELHGELMVGKIGDRVVETAACWVLVLIASGVYLWWRGPARRRVRTRKGRPLLRRVHALTGVTAGIVIVFMVVSGLPWSGVWGEGLQKFSTKIGSTSPDSEKYAKQSTPLAGDLSKDPDTKVPWAAEDQPVPPSDPGGGGHSEHGGGSGNSVGAIPVERALNAVRASTPHCPPGPCDYKVLLPKGERGVYTVTVSSRGNPADERTLHVDQYSGKVLGSYGWKEYGTLAKAVEQGISLHEGRRYGPANTALMLGACLAVITLLVTGVWMWWKRRPQGSAGAPRRPADKRTTLVVAAIMLVLGVIFPLAGITMLAALLVDAVLIQRVPWLSRRLG